MPVMPTGRGPAGIELEDVIDVFGSSGDHHQIIFDPTIDDSDDTRTFKEFEAMSLDLLADEAGENGPSIAVARTREDLEGSPDRRPDRIPPIRVFEIDPGISQTLDIEGQHGAATFEAGHRQLSGMAQRFRVTRSGVADIAMSDRKFVHIRSQRRSGIPTVPVKTAMNANRSSLAGPRRHVDSTL
jgi:hypothetical protein